MSIALKMLDCKSQLAADGQPLQGLTMPKLNGFIARHQLMKRSGTPWRPVEKYCFFDWLRTIQGCAAIFGGCKRLKWRC